MKLIIGLGNPGNKYKNTRHNLGYKVVDFYLDKKNISPNYSKFGGTYFKGMIADQEVIIAKPITFMNNSGEFIRRITNFYKINLTDILIIYDENNIIEGSYKIKNSGKSSRHNGIKSILLYLQTEYFARLKCGIYNKENNRNLIDYVLEDFSKQEMKIVEGLFPRYLEIIDDFIINDYPYIVNKYNNK